MFDLRSFIYLKNAKVYDDELNGAWIHDLGFSLHHKKNIIMTRNILQLLFLGSRDMKDSDEFKEAIFEYEKILKENEVCYDYVDLEDDKTFEEFPHAREYEVGKLLSLNKSAFLKSLKYVPNAGKSLKAFLTLDEIVKEYSEYVNDIEKEKIKKLIIRVTKELCLKS